MSLHAMGFPRAARQVGFTLVELMVALALGLLILLALMMMLTNISRTNNELGVSNRMVENGRFAMQLVSGEVVHAGFFAGHVPNYDDLTFTAQPLPSNDSSGAPATRKQVPSALPDPCLAYSVANWTAAHKYNLVGIAVQGSNVPAAGTAPFCAGVVSSPKRGTDVLVVRHAETCVGGSGTNECSNTLATANPDVYFQATRCDTDTAEFVLSTMQADFTLRQRNCTTAAELRRFASSMYFVKDVSGVPTLMRSVLRASGAAPTHDAADALVENVEGFRVEYGLDTLSDSNEAVAPTAAISWTNLAVKTSPRNRGDGIPDGAYVRCTQANPCTPAQMLNAVAVRIYVLVRAERTTAGHTDSKIYKLGSADTACANAAAADSSNTCAPTLGPFNDGYRRQLFTQTVRLANVAGRRETP
jgi:type IV pilus assembly protein PilW